MLAPAEDLCVPYLTLGVRKSDLQPWPWLSLSSREPQIDSTVLVARESWRGPAGFLEGPAGFLEEMLHAWPTHST